MHTKFSNDATSEPEAMIQSAIEKRLQIICITDHQDMDYPREGMFGFDTAHYFEVLSHLKEKYKHQIEVRIGVEVGLQPHLRAEIKEYVNRYPFDFVIGSIHIVDRMDPYYPEFFENRTDEEGYTLAFQDTIKSLNNIDDFDVLGHIDYIVRYGKEKAKNYTYEKYKEYIDEILKLAIKKGKGIELNTSGFKYGLGFCHPHPDIIRRYRELGGEIITIGADGHRPEHIAYDFHKVGDILKSCNFKYYTEFCQRKPIFKQLP